MRTLRLAAVPVRRIADAVPARHLPGAAGMLIAGGLSLALWGGIIGVASLIV